MKVTLKAARVNQNLSQTEVGKQIGVSKSTIARWESGQLDIPPNQLEKLAAIYNIKIKNLEIKKGD